MTRCVCFILALACLSVAAAQRPNIIYILADDLGWGDLGCYGQKTLKTPHLDRLAREGMRFTRHYAGSTVCAPSRCVLLTGCHTGHARIRGNGPGRLLETDVTFAKLLQRHGYQTGCFGKWGIGNPPHSMTLPAMASISFTATLTCFTRTISIPSSSSKTAAK